LVCQVPPEHIESVRRQTVPEARRRPAQEGAQLERHRLARRIDDVQRQRRRLEFVEDDFQLPLAQGSPKLAGESR
jgi:hypothetical protein